MRHFLHKFKHNKENKDEDILYNQGKILSNRLREKDISNIHQAEFSIHSQWGEDGIIEYILQNIDQEIDKKFVEFGIQGYTNSNTKFLLKNRNWRGLLIDGSQDNIDMIQKSDIYWKYDIRAVQRFITRENINNILSDTYEGEIGLLSIDIDGNDYWIWKEINEIKPSIVVIEYNSIFGNKHPITIPYQGDFVRNEAHHSNLYFGSSLPALTRLAEEKGYTFIGCNTNGNNAFFIRKNIDIDIEPKSAKTGWVESKFRESRNKQGELNYLSGRERVDEIENMSVYHIQREKEMKVKELRPLY